ncbi:protein-arginine deiminase type-2 [Takifugu rubripes]|uniref:Protein-arginine deiminase n=1 Tax=Takifugu rubripes TaxID=31033 RepID=A0A674PMQ3_TAKRU|nr:protein-arginine deiminase type-2 [Takifugu rubripes]|eukprot:XP_011611944.1 PREDICTED: protein-arginine deiminase type-2-like [Takifugu rubripes]
MAHNRTLGLYCDQTISVVYVVGSDLLINSNRCAPPGTDFFSVKCTPNVQYIISPPPQETSHLSPLPLSGDSMIIVRMSHASDTENESKLSVRYYGSDKKVLGTARLYLTALEISLDVDADRDGVVERNNPNKGSWKWGPNGHGAVLLVNCDCERTYWKTPDSEKTYISKVSDLKDMSLMVLRTRGPAKLPNDYKLTLHISQSDAESVRVFRSKLTGKQNVTSYSFTSFLNDYPLVLSREVLSQEVPYLGGDAEINFYVEGLRFTDKDFNGLISVNLSVLEPISERVPETPIFTDKVVFRVAPWIMTPNTLDPLEVFVCSTADNYQFLKGMKNFVGKSGHKLKICYEYMNRGDRWMQDELEFGYIDSPHQRFPVVLDSPRDGKLQDFPYKELLGPDFGYVTREPDRENISSLDSFGNLEVSPPVTVNGKNYPFGRILIGVAFPTATKGRNMTKVVQDFLWAQKVQDPIALFSDWLYVGHVDEFMTFVPAPDRKGFRLLLASPDAAFKLFRRLQSNGHGEAKLFEDLTDEESITVDEILNDDSFHVQNMYVQSCINWNRDVLKRELGLEEEDIIDLPILFKLVVGTKHQDAYRALAYYPDMVNMIVLGKHLGIPKPFGPKVDGHCALEAEMCSLMEGLGLKCTFIDDFASYHKLLGEVHCGSNVRRGMFDFKWWNLEM